MTIIKQKSLYWAEACASNGVSAREFDSFIFIYLMPRLKKKYKKRCIIILQILLNFFINNMITIYDYIIDNIINSDTCIDSNSNLKNAIIYNFSIFHKIK